MEQTGETVKVVIPQIACDQFPDGFTGELGIEEIRKILPYSDLRLRIHAVGRISKPFRWAGLLFIPGYLTEGHFGILPGCEFPEILAQAGMGAMVLEYGWTAIRRVFATKMSWEAMDQGEGPSVQARTGDLLQVVIDKLMVDSMSGPGKEARRICSEISGRLLVGNNEIATATACGVGIVVASSWSNVFAAQESAG